MMRLLLLQDSAHYFPICFARMQLRSMLSWDDFRYVKAIADTRSLGGAAAELGVNHSTVFRRLAQIETQLGSRLFERSRSAYALTPCGEEMVRLAERMGEDIVTFERQVTGHDLRPSGELRVTTNDVALVYLMTDVFADFRRAYPEISLDVVVANQALNLSKRDADVAIRATDHPPETLIGRRVAGTAWAVFAIWPRIPVRQAKNQMIIIITVCECRYNPEPGSNLPRIQT